MKKKPNIVVRKARLKESPILAGLTIGLMIHDDSLALGYDPYRNRKKDFRSISTKFMRNSIRSATAVVYVAEIDGKIVGYALAIIRKNPPIFKIEKFGLISDLYIKEDYRGLGIGTMFKDEAEKWFKKKGLKQAGIRVNVKNEGAHRLYKRWGFSDFITDMRKKI